MRKTLKEIVTATLVAGALALTASCVAVPVPVDYPHRHFPAVIVYEPVPVIIYRFPTHSHYIHSRSFQNPTCYRK
jgi:hypothetical protein